MLRFARSAPTLFANSRRLVATMAQKRIDIDIVSDTVWCVATALSHPECSRLPVISIGHPSLHPPPPPSPSHSRSYFTHVLCTPITNGLFIGEGKYS